MWVRALTGSFCAGFAVLIMFGSTTQAGVLDPWGDTVVSFVPGTGSDPAFGDAATTLGSPERFTGEGVFPSVVSMFNPPFGANEIVSIGFGGELVVGFNQPIVDDASHPFGIDLIVFGNAGFIDTVFPQGQIGSPASTFGADPMEIAVSADGATFVTLGAFTEGIFPTQGYLDSDPFDSVPGSQPTDFTKPMNPDLTLSDFDGLSHADALALYAGSGGGTPIDIASSGLSEVNFVRVRGIMVGVTVEIDAFAAVPEPASATLWLSLVFIRSAFRREKQNG